MVGTEVQTPAGRIDILAIEREKIVWVIETKIGTATRDAVAQIQSYMAAVKDIEEYESLDVVGVLIAESFDEKCKYALQIIQNVSTLCYSVGFTLAGTNQNDVHQIPDYSEELNPWVVDINRKVFHPKNDTKNIFFIEDRYLVNEVLRNNIIELQADNFSVGIYSRINSK